MSLGDGDLREDLQAEGIPVHLTGGLGGGAAEVYECRVQELACVIERQDCDVVLCNTIDTFFIAHAAERVGLPVVWAVHEHFDLAQWWPYRSDRIQGSFAFHSFYEALRAADRLVFEAEATRSLYREMLGSDNGTVIYYGIDTAGIDEYRQRFSKSELRAAIGVPDDATVVLNMGMFEPRKAQAMIVDVFSRLASRHDDLVLLLVGAGENPYTESLESFVEALDLGADRVIMKPASRDVWGYYGAADLLIGAADIESMPRSFMEAMAFGLPIITTDVAGCKELVFDGVSGWTCPIRTAGGLELAWERALLSPEVWPQFAAAGRDLLERRHVNEAHARKVAQLLHDVARRRR
jgi:glycosyltransferase involved in cell wall biosynthesis